MKRGTGEVQNEKTQLRRLLRDRRRSLSSAEVREKSRLIFEQLRSLPPFLQAATIVLYNADENEVQTEAIWQEAIRQNKAVYYPRITTDKANLEFVRRLPGDQLMPGTFGILIPPGNELLASVSETDVVLTPGVGFHHYGHRLGRGRGYYDRAFRGVLAGALRIALAYESQVVAAIPTAADDEPVHFIVTETQLIPRAVESPRV
jgi:5-formyltetrahydrofolate cyclo-ligase